MKKLLLLYLGMLTLSTVQANDTSLSTTTGVHYVKKKAITFIEGGIRFHVYLSGNFTYAKFKGKRQRSVLKTSRNGKGLINRIGRVAIYYNRQNKVTWIGSVGVRYRKGYLNRVGNLAIHYDSHSRASFNGRVNRNGIYQSYTHPRYKSASHRVSYYSNNSPHYKDRKALFNNESYDFYNPFFYQTNFKRDYLRYKSDNHFIYYHTRKHGKARYKKIKRKVKRASNAYKPRYKDVHVAERERINRRKRSKNPYRS